MKVRDYAGPLLLHSFLACAIFAATWLVVGRWVRPSYLPLMLCSAIQAVLFAPAAFFAGFTAGERAKLWATALSAAGIGRKPSSPSVA
jgi:hypothetical protein